MLKTKIRLRIHLKLWKGQKMLYNRSHSIKDRIRRAVQVCMWDKAYVKVNYGKGVFNDGYYYNMPDFNKALSAFTEKLLIEYLRK